MEILMLLSFIGMVILTTINLYISYITFKLLRETVIIRKETILIREISEKVRDKL